MFPNPQDALPLPRRPNLERYQNLAGELVKACKSGEANAIGDWAEKLVNMIAQKSDVGATRGIHRWVEQVKDFAQRQLASAPCRLGDAQLVIARSHGFESRPN